MLSRRRRHRYFEGIGDQVTPAGAEVLLASGGDGGEERWEGLLAAAQQGDARAYDRLLHALLPFARAIARRHLRSADAVEDAVQEALITLHRVRHTWQEGRPVAPWFAAIVARRSIDVARRQSRIGGREMQSGTAIETFADPQANAQRQTEASRSVGTMMNALTPKQKEAVELVKLKEMSLEEAAAASGQSVGSLKVNVHRAIRRLRRLGFGANR